MDERQQTAGIFQCHTFMDHRQLQMCIGVINRDTAVFGQQYQKEGNAGQHACYRQVDLIRTQAHACQRGAVGVQYVRQHGQHYNRLNKGSHINLTAAAHTTEGGGCIHRGNCHKEASQGQQINENKNVAEAGLTA